MKPLFWLWMVSLVMVGVEIAGAQAPTQVGGFELGRYISEYVDVVKMETSMPIRYREYLRQVEIIQTPEFKTGLITFGTCVDSGRIVQIKLKYADSGKKFYEEILKKYRERFGNPKEYRGDTFQIFIAWKWSFVDQNDRRISLTLQHNQEDIAKKIGNSVKLTLIDSIDEEKRCHAQKTAREIETLRRQKHEKQKHPLNFDLLIPQ